MNERGMKYLITRCSACGNVVDTTETFRTAMKWFDEYQKTKQSDYPGRLCSPYAHTQGDAKDIAELNRLYAQEDNRQ